jgi:hydrogenase maturation factor
MEATVKTPNAVKMDIMKKSLQEWKLLERIERAGLEIAELVKRCDGKMQFEDDLHNYVEDLKATVDVLMKS